MDRLNWRKMDEEPEVGQDVLLWNTETSEVVSGWHLNSGCFVIHSGFEEEGGHVVSSGEYDMWAALYMPYYCPDEDEEICNEE